MKKFKIILIIYLIITAIIIGFFLLERKTTVLDNVFYNEPVIENKISIKAKEIHD